ncbi:MAG: ornithine cyclodeaminase family protein [Halopenitus sp.]
MVSRLYSATDVAARLDVADALDVVERTYVETARGRVLNPPKLSMQMGDDGTWPNKNAFAIDMPAYVDWLNVAGTKWAVAAWDADTSDPISSLILLFDVDSGEFKTVMEGMYLTGVRTALQSVVGLKHLTNTPPDSVGVLGAGFMACHQLQVVDELVDVDAFRLYDVDADQADSLAADLAPELEADLVVTETAREAVASDALITVTDSKTPVLEDDWLDDSGLVVALGSYRELPDATIHGADRIVVDDVDQCLQRGALADLADRGQLTRADLDRTIGDVLDGDTDETWSPDDRTVFVPIGLGSLDVALAECVYAAEGAAAGIPTFDFT